MMEIGKIWLNDLKGVDHTDDEEENVPRYANLILIFNTCPKNKLLHPI